MMDSHFNLDVCMSSVKGINYSTLYTGDFVYSHTFWIS